MPLTPRTRISLMVGAMIGAALLSYTILTNIQPSDTQNMKTAGKKVPVASRAATPVPQSPLPDAVFYDAAGKDFTLEAFKGDVLLVNLWATWCPPCIAELPSLDMLQAHLREDGLKVLAISMDRKPVEEVSAFLAARKVEQLDVYIDREREIARKWQYVALPASYLIDRQGNVLEVFMGPREWTKGQVFDSIKAALQTLPPASR